MLRDKRTDLWQRFVSYPFVATLCSHSNTHSNARTMPSKACWHTSLNEKESLTSRFSPHTSPTAMLRLAIPSVVQGHRTPLVTTPLHLASLSSCYTLRIMNTTCARDSTDSAETIGTLDAILAAALNDYGKSDRSPLTNAPPLTHQPPQDSCSSQIHTPAKKS